MTMQHSDKDIERAAQRYEQLTNNLDPAAVNVEQTEDLQSIATVAEAVRADEARLRDVVESAREQGRSWNQIAVALGVSRQAARQRFSSKASE
ncbi:MAG TPA: hypothetical protein VHW74_13590 [Mycobacteriales bacterium]|jgi:hypothetical protein|nr:hypothetical protein [Mycobacteriales bacterium]